MTKTEIRIQIEGYEQQQHPVLPVAVAVAAEHISRIPCAPSGYRAASLCRILPVRDKAKGGGGGGEGEGVSQKVLQVWKLKFCPAWYKIICICTVHTLYVQYTIHTLICISVYDTYSHKI